MDPQKEMKRNKGVVTELETRKGEITDSKRGKIGVPLDEGDELGSTKILEKHSVLNQADEEMEEEEMGKMARETPKGDEQGCTSTRMRVLLYRSRGAHCRPRGIVVYDPDHLDVPASLHGYLRRNQLECVASRRD